MISQQSIIIKYQDGITVFKDNDNNYVNIKNMIHYLNYCYKILNKYKFGFLISNFDVKHIVALYMDLHKLQLYYQNSWGTPPINKNLDINDSDSFYFVNDIINQLYRFMMSFYTNYNKLCDYLNNNNNNSIEKLNDHYKNLINTVIQQYILIYLTKTLHENYETTKRQYEEYDLFDEEDNLDILKQFINDYKSNQNFFNDDNNINILDQIKGHIRVQLDNIIDEFNKRKYIRKGENFVKMDKRKYINNCIEKIYEQMISLSLYGDTIDKDDKKEIFNDNMQIINKFFDIRYNNRKVQYKYGICTLFAITFIVRLVEGYSFDNFKNIKETEDDILHYRSKYLNSF